MSLPLDTQIRIMSESDPATLLSYCSANSELYSICSAAYFYGPYLSKYGLTLQEIPGENFQEKLAFVASFNWDWGPGETLQRRGQYIIRILNRIPKEDLKTFVYERFRGLVQGTQFASLSYGVNRSFRSILLAAVRTNSPNFVRYVLESLLKLIEHVEDYYHCFRDPLIELMYNLTDPQSTPSALEIYKIINQYYNPSRDTILFAGTYAKAVKEGNYHIVTTLSQIFLPSEETFWAAIESSQTGIATFIRNQLLLQGIDPVADTQVVNDIYVRAVENSNLDLIGILSVFVLPTKEHLALAQSEEQEAVVDILNDLLNK